MTEDEQDLSWIMDQSIYDMLNGPSLEERLTAFLREEEQRCMHKIRTLGDTSIVGRCAQSRMNLIEKVRLVLAEKTK